ncbi:MAG: acyltransferase [Reichenbachiella sp.]|uniref:acyltransferase family protein n=1 Tax=Reichenbachiella sp. TaxID=2184521 RepID=UPI0032973F48
MKIEQLTFTRFLAAFLVVIFHFGRDVFPFNAPFWSFLFDNGDLFVSFFFVLSGFVMVIAYHSKKIEFFRYLKMRIARIYPVHILGVVLLLISYSMVDRKAPLFEIFIQSLLVHPWYPRFSLILNYPSWSLAVEMLFYSLFPFIMVLLNKNKLQVNIVIALSLWVFSQLISYLLKSHVESETIWLFVNFHPLIHLNEFVIGNLFALLFLLNRTAYRINTWHLVGLIIMLLLLIKFPFPWVNYKNGFLAPIFGLVILGLSQNNSSLKQAFAHHQLILLGEISYAIYILQVPIHSITFYCYNQAGYTDKQLFFYVFVVVLLICSYLSYYLIEMPGKRLINRINIPFG